MHESAEAIRSMRENDLVRSGQQGSHQAFAELLQRSRPRLWRAAVAILKSPEEAKDVLHNASWKAFTHVSTFRLDSTFNTWLASIVINQARMRLRELRRAWLVSMEGAAEDRPVPLSQTPVADPTPEQIRATSELVRVLHQEICRLPRQLRQVMQFHVGDLSMPEAAERPGLTVTATKTRLFRARHEFYARMRRHLEVPAVTA
jgi:RNA polymerase sigma-70 factor (ECF subfamily)